MNIINQATSLAKALAAQIAAGMPMASKEEKSERHQICQLCDKFNEEEYRCNECGCFLKLKIPLKTSMCPLGKWKDLMKEEVKDE